MKYTILGNCQAAPISKLLAGQPEFSEKFDFMPLPAPVHMFKPHHLTAIHNVLASVDLFIYQFAIFIVGKLPHRSTEIKIFRQK